MGREFDLLRNVSSVSQSQSEHQPKPHTHPNAQLCLTPCLSLLQAQAECYLRIPESQRTPIHTYSYPGIISPHIDCPFLATVYSFLSAVLHIPPGEAMADLLCLDQCWQQKLPSLHSCAVFAIKVTCEVLGGEKPSRALLQGLQIIYGRCFREPQVPFPGHFSHWGHAVGFMGSTVQLELRDNEEQFWSEGTSS